MILPSKNIRIDQSLIGIGAEILNTLVKPMTVSTLWNNVQRHRSSESDTAAVSYSWFVLALDMLYMIGAIGYESGLLKKAKK